jgi:hypothetical protein
VKSIPAFLKSEYPALGQNLNRGDIRQTMTIGYPKGIILIRLSDITDMNNVFNQGLYCTHSLKSLQQIQIYVLFSPFEAENRSGFRGKNGAEF